MINTIEKRIKERFKTWSAYEKEAGLTTRNGKRRIAFLLTKLSALLKPLGLTLKIEEDE